MKRPRNHVLRMISATVCAALAMGAMAQAPSAPKPGEAAPEIAVEKWLSGPGGTITLKSLKGNAVVLEFWAAWCGPCVAAIPHMNQLVEKFKDKPIRFLAVTDDVEARVQNLLTRRPMSAWVGMDTDHSVFQTYRVTSIPRTALIDKEGKLVALTHPAFVTEEALGNLIAGKPVQASLAPGAGNTAEMGREPAAPLFETVIRQTEDPNGSFSYGQNQLISHAAPLEMAIGVAYGVRATRVVAKTPLADRKYTILVRTPEGHPELLTPVLRQALEASFDITTRKETREGEAFVMTAPKGAGAGLKTSQAAKPGTQITGNRLRGEGNDLDELAAEIEQVVESPVVDETGLKGTYDWDVSWSPENPESFFKALRDQLGIEVEKKQRPVDYLVVEKVNPAAEKGSQPEKDKERLPPPPHAP